MVSSTSDRINGVVGSVAFKAPVKAATTANITLSGEQTIDGVSCVADDRVLVKNQTDQTENGIYVVATGTWERSKDFDGNRDAVQGTQVHVYGGTVNGGINYRVTTADDVEIETDNITFSDTTRTISYDTGSFLWNFDSTVTMADPGTGDFRLNNATVASATAMAVSATDADGNTMRPFVLTWDDSTNTSHRGTIVLKDADAPTTFAVFSVTGASTDNTSWVQLALTYVTGNGTFTNGNDFTVMFSRTGNVGANGAGSGDLLAAQHLGEIAALGGTAQSNSRTNLGLGTIATQDASSVAITGGSITGITDLAVADGGTGASSFTADAILKGNGTSAVAASGVSIDSNNQIYGYKANFNAQTGTTYTLVAGDTGKTVTLNNASAITVTLPNSLAEGFECECIQLGAGQVTFSAAGGATLNNRQSHSKIAGQHAAVRLKVTGNSGGSSAVYNLAGDTGA